MQSGQKLASDFSFLAISMFSLSGIFLVNPSWMHLSSRGRIILITLTLSFGWGALYFCGVVWALGAV